jgi:hypothetical protein
VRPPTKWRNKSSLRKVLKDVLGKEKIEEARCEILTEDLADKFLSLRATRARAAVNANPVTIERAKVSANSTLNQARSVLGKNACRLYREFSCRISLDFARLKVESGPRLHDLSAHPGERYQRDRSRCEQD